jgi:hypothetical protein
MKIGGASALRLTLKRLRFAGATPTPKSFTPLLQIGTGTKANGGPEEILGNPACEAATALLIYWSCGPEFYLQYANREEVPDYLVDGYDLLTTIEARYVAGEFLAGLIAFDPANPADVPSGLSLVGVYDDARDKFVRALPPLMYAPVPALSR